MPKTNSQLKKTAWEPIPQEYAKPYRKTAFILPQPSVINNGVLLKEHGRRYGGVLDINQARDDALSDLYSRNIVTESMDRVTDVRSMDFTTPQSQGFHTR